MTKVLFHTSLLLLIIGCMNTTSIEDNSSWRYRYDFDQDNQMDTINYTYSGGAHCCYQLSINLSSLKQEIEIPYEIEGGYIVFDLSKPDNFNILDIDKDGRPEIVITGVQAESDPSEEIEHVFMDFEKGGHYYNSIQYKPLVQ